MVPATTKQLPTPVASKSKVKPTSRYLTSISVEKVCTKTGRVLERFPSLGLAAVHTGIGKSTLRRWANGDCNCKEKGVIWRHALHDDLNGFSVEHHHVRNSKLVQKICPKTGEILQTFESVGEAARSVNVTTTSISGVCHGRNKTAGGFVWKLAGWRNERHKSLVNGETDGGDLKEDSPSSPEGEQLRPEQDLAIKIEETERPTMHNEMPSGPSAIVKRKKNSLKSKIKYSVQVEEHGRKASLHKEQRNTEDHQEYRPECGSHENNIHWDSERPHLLPSSIIVPRVRRAPERHLLVQHRDRIGSFSHPYSTIHDTTIPAMPNGGHRVRLFDPHIFHIHPNSVPQPQLAPVSYHYIQGPGPELVPVWGPPPPLHLQEAEIWNAAPTYSLPRARYVLCRVPERFPREERVPHVIPEQVRSYAHPTHPNSACRHKYYP